MTGRISSAQRRTRPTLGFVTGYHATARHKVAVNFPPELFNKIADAAFDTDRSFSAQVVAILEGKI